MGVHYGSRNSIASGFHPAVTMSVIYEKRTHGHASRMLGKSELLAALRARGITNAEIARTLGLPPPRITELYKGDRDLTLDEAKKLVDRFGLERIEVPSEPDLRRMLAAIQQELPMSTSYGEWPRIAAPALYDRLAQFLASEAQRDSEPDSPPPSGPSPRDPTKPDA